MFLKLLTHKILIKRTLNSHFTFFPLSGPLLKSSLNFFLLLLFYILIFWPQGMWDLKSPVRDHALQGKVLTTCPPGKPQIIILKFKISLKDIENKPDKYKPDDYNWASRSLLWGRLDLKTHAEQSL